MDEVLIIPDVHGRTFWKEPCSEFKGKIVFLGDYLDPYFKEHIKDALSNFKQIVEFAKGNPNCVLLIGNHDLGYIHPNDRDCTNISRYVRNSEATKLFQDNKDLFRIYYKYDNYLFSHAGVMQEWLDGNAIDLDHIELDHLLQCSALRGGINKYGSCVWGDVRAFSNSRKEYQIFGHTQLKEPYITETFACLDCRKAFLLKNNKIEEYNKEH